MEQPLTRTQSSIMIYEYMSYIYMEPVNDETISERTWSKDVNELKLKIEQEKVSKGEQASDISVWSEEMDTKLEEVIDRYIHQLVDCVQIQQQNRHI
jgi:chromosome segregation and condensation protein ScpB